MSETRYNIEFSGELLAGHELDSVKANLAQLFKCPLEKIEPLFSGQTVTLKRNLSEAEAEQYLGALRRAGAAVRKQPDSVQLSLMATEDHPEPNQAPLAAEQAPLMSCPKCGHQQPKAAECSACGIIIEKYLARQAELAANPLKIEPTSPYQAPQAALYEDEEGYGPLNYFTTNGRIGRARYIAWSMGLMLAALLGYGLAIGLMMATPILGGILIFVVLCAIGVVSVMIAAQRLHDIGWSAWLLLINLIPVVGGIFSLLLLGLPGQKERNQYGPPPPPNSTGVLVLAWSSLVVPVLGIALAISIPSYQNYIDRQIQHEMQQMDE